MKKSKIIKSISLMLVLLMSLSLFAGCGSNEPETSEVEKVEVNTEDVELGEEPLTFTMLYEENPSYPYKEDWLVLEEIKKRLNVDLQLQLVPTSDFAERRTVVFNSGEMPDIIGKTFASDISSYISSGLFLPISDYVDQMPNFKAFIEKYDYYDDLDNIREADGKYYQLPVNSNPQAMTYHGWMIRMDLVEDYGIEIPETLDEVYEACKIFKEHNPDAYPITNRFGSANILFKVGPAFNTIAGWGLGNMFKYQPDSDTFEFAPTTEEYKEMLKWMHKMYSEELLDVEFTTLDSTVYEERAKNGEQFILVDWIGNEVRYNEVGPEQSGNPDFNIQPIMPPKGPWGHYSSTETPKFEQGWVISAAVAEREDFPEFLKFIDWFYSDEAAELMTFGIEGETFTVNEEGRKEFLTPGYDYNCKEYGVYNNVLTVRRDDDAFTVDKSEYVIDLFDQMFATGEIFTKKQPTIRLTEDEKEEVSLYNTGLLDYVNQMTEKFIFGVASIDDDWDTFVQECENKGRQELHDIYNNAWQNQNK